MNKQMATIIKPALNFFTHDGQYVQGGCDRCMCATLNGMRCRRATCKHRQCCWQHSRLDNAMYDSITSYTNATDLDRRKTERAFHKQNYDAVVRKKAELLAARRDLTTVSKLEAAYLKAQEDGTIDLQDSDDSSTDHTIEDGQDEQDVGFEQSQDDGPPLRIYLLYGGGGNPDEDSYAAGDMLEELKYQLDEMFPNRQLAVEAIGGKSSMLASKCEPDSPSHRTLLVLWRDFLGGRGSESWTGVDGARSFLQNWPCIPNLKAVTSIFSKRPYLEILQKAKIPTIRTEIIYEAQFRAIELSPTEWFERMTTTFKSPKFVMKLPNCSQGRSLVVCTNANTFAQAVGTAKRQNAPFIMVQPFTAFNEVRVFVASSHAHRAVLTLHKDNEMELLRRFGLPRSKLGLHCTVPISRALAKLALAAFDAVVAGGIAIMSARIDIGVVNTACEISDDRLMCSNVGSIQFVNEVSCVESDVFPDAPSGGTGFNDPETTLEAFTKANVSEIVSEISKRLSGTIE